MSKPCKLGYIFKFLLIPALAGIILGCGQNVKPNVPFPEDLPYGTDASETDDEFVIIEKKVRDAELIPADLMQIELKVYTVDSEASNLSGSIISNYREDGTLDWVKIYEYDGDQFTERVVEFNDAGMIASDVAYDFNGKAISKSVFEYDEYYRLTNEVSLSNSVTNYNVQYVFDDFGNTNEIVRYGEKGVFQGMRIFNYDDNNRLIDEALYNGDGYAFYEYVVTYTKKGNIETMTLNQADGTYDDYMVFGYDKEGLLESVNTYSDSEGRLKLITIYDYDFDEQTIRKSIYLTNGSMDHTLVIYYDDQGRWIQKEYLDRFGLNYRLMNWEYDEAGNMTNYESLLYGYVIEKYVSNFNELGLLTLAAEYGDNEELIHKTVFEYDDVGHLLAETYYGDEDEFDYRYEYYYNEYGELTNSTEYETDFLLDETVNYKYDRFGLLVREDETDYLYLDPMESLLIDATADVAIDTLDIQTVIRNTLIEYEYDVHGTLIGKTTYKGGEIVEVITGEAEYY